MMEAEIDPSTEPMVVDSSSDCHPLGKTLEVQAVSGTLDSGQFISSSVHHSHTTSRQFGCVQGLAAQSSKEDLEVIEVRAAALVLIGIISAIRTDPSPSHRSSPSTPSCQTPASPTWWWSPAASWRSPTTPASSWRKSSPWSRKWTAAMTRRRRPALRTSPSLDPLLVDSSVASETCSEVFY